MTVRPHDATNNKDWQLYCLHQEAQLLMGAMSLLIRRIERHHGTHVFALSAAAAQQILNGKERQS
jgi:hypothetical protein